MTAKKEPRDGSEASMKEEASGKSDLETESKALDHLPNTRIMPLESYSISVKGWTGVSFK